MKWGVSAAVRERCSDLKPQECCAAALLPRRLGWGAAAAAVVQLHPAVGKCVYEWDDPHEATSEEAEVLHSPEPLSQERVSHPAECCNVLLTAKFYGKPHRKADARLRSQEICKAIYCSWSEFLDQIFLGFSIDNSQHHFSGRTMNSAENPKLFAPRFWDVIPAGR